MGNTWSLTGGVACQSRKMEQNSDSAYPILAHQAAIPLDILIDYHLKCCILGRECKINVTGTSPYPGLRLQFLKGLVIQNRLKRG